MTIHKGVIMLNKSVKSVLGKGAILIIFVSLFFTTLVATPPAIPEAPVKIEISVSKDKIYVGDSLDVYATITLLKDHPNYVKGTKYRMAERKTYAMIHLGEKLVPPPNPIPRLWEILYSDKDKILDDNNPHIDFHFRQKLNLMPDRKNLYITIGVMPTTRIHASFMNPLADLINERIEVECLEEGLEYKSVIFPKNRKYQGDVLSLDPSEPRPEVNTDILTKATDLKETNPELFKIEPEKVESKLNSLKGRCNVQD